MFQFFNDNLNIAGNAVASAHISFSGNIDNHIIAYAGGNFDFNDFFTSNYAFTLAMVTFVLDDLSFALAMRTYRLGLHHAEEALMNLIDIT